MDDFEILFVDDDQTILNIVEEYLSAVTTGSELSTAASKLLSSLKPKILMLSLPTLRCPISTGSSFLP